MSTRQPLSSTQEDGVRLGHNGEAIRRNSKVTRIENGRLKEDAEPQRLDGGVILGYYREGRTSQTKDHKLN